MLPQNEEGPAHSCLRIQCHSRSLGSVKFFYLQWQQQHVEICWNSCPLLHRLRAPCNVSTISCTTLSCSLLAVLLTTKTAAQLLCSAPRVLTSTWLQDGQSRMPFEWSLHSPMGAQMLPHNQIDSEGQSEGPVGQHLAVALAVHCLCYWHGIAFDPLAWAALNPLVLPQSRWGPRSQA